MSLLSIARIRTDGGTQTRACIRKEVVSEYAALNGEMPAVVVFYDEHGVYWLADGFHRLEARKEQGKRDIECDIREGSLRQAVLYSFTANHRHGLRLSTEDKRYAVAKCLNDPEWAKMSDRWIADTCGCAHPLVSEMRKNLVEDSSTRTGSDGRTVTVRAKVYCDRCKRLGTPAKDCKNCLKAREDDKEKRDAAKAERDSKRALKAAERAKKAAEKAQAKDERERQRAENKAAKEKAAADKAAAKAKKEEEKRKAEEGREPGIDPEESPVTDALGHTVPAPLIGAFVADFDKAVSLCQQLQSLIDVLACNPGGEQLARFVAPKRSGEKVIQRSKHLDDLKADIKGTRPHAVCPYCVGKANKTCKGCNGTGWVTKRTWDGATDTEKARLAS